MIINGERALAYVVRIDDIQPIEGADFIEKAVVGGWNVVVKKGDFNVGDLACYIEIDSWVPNYICPFLTQDGHYPKVYNGVEGQRLKTKKLKDTYSQGLLLSFNYLSNIVDKIALEQMKEGTNVTELLDIQKWERPIPAELRGQMKGDFPSHIPKTSQERVQNLTKVLPNYHGLSFSVEEKLHGTSMTVYSTFEDDDYGIKVGFGVCSRNIELKPSETNTYWKIAYDNHLFDILFDMYTNYGCHYALQGEMIGEGINGNMYGLKGQTFKLFDIYNITEGKYLNPIERFSMWNIVSRNASELHVPILNNLFILNETRTSENLLEMVEHKSTLNGKVWAEGWVLKCNERPFTFKVVSNKFLTSKRGEDA